MFSVGRFGNVSMLITIDNGYQRAVRRKWGKLQETGAKSGIQDSIFKIGF